ncbi:hypothetical protein IAT38_000747 [Cryptococcus sp. DSM 104549]
MSKRGLSMEEKKVKMLEIFHDTAEFYSLKELEKIAPIQQSVKDVIDDLVGDGLVIMDKIGTGNYFWALPSAAGATKHAMLGKAVKELEKADSGIAEARAGVKAAEKGREDTETRRTLLAQLSSLQTTSQSLKSELAAFGAADPVRYEEKRRAIGVCKDAAVRWTDNTLVLLQYTNSLGAEDAQIRGALGIGEEWEDLKM